MADVLDTVLADMAQLTTDANAILQELAQVQSGNIPVTDPRFQQLVSTISQLDTAMKAQLPPAPTPNPTP